MSYTYQVVVKDYNGNIIDVHNHKTRVEAEKQQRYLETFCSEVEVRDIWDSSDTTGGDWGFSSVGLGIWDEAAEERWQTMVIWERERRARLGEFK